MTIHPLDEATSIQVGPDGLRRCHTHPAYGNMIGPFGGVTAATLLNGILTHEHLLGEPVALTVNYAAALADGTYELDVLPLRTNRSTQHWYVCARQGGQVVASATAVFAQRRETWSFTEARAPVAPVAGDIGPSVLGAVHRAWFDRYEMRFVRGTLASDAQNDQSHAADSETVVWMRDAPPRHLDHLSLTAMADAFAPRIMVKRQRRTPIGTVSLSVYFHCSEDTLRLQSDRHVLGVANANHFGRGFHDQSAQLWSEEKVLMATSHQVVYFKE